MNFMKKTTCGSREIPTVFCFLLGRAFAPNVRRLSIEMCITAKQKHANCNPEPPVTDLLGPYLHSLPILVGLCQPLLECQSYQQKWSKDWFSANDSVGTGILAHITKKHCESSEVCYSTPIRRDRAERAHPTPKLCQSNACSTAQPVKHDSDL